MDSLAGFFNVFVDTLQKYSIIGQL